MVKDTFLLRILNSEINWKTVVFLDVFVFAFSVCYRLIDDNHADSYCDNDMEH